MIIVKVIYDLHFNAKIPSAQFIYRYFNLSLLSDLCFQWSRSFCGQISYEHSLGWFDFLKVFMPSKCLQMMSCQVLHSMSLEVSSRVYIVPMVMHLKALFWKTSFLEIEDQNCPSDPGNVLASKTTQSNFGSATWSSQLL